MDYDYYTLKNIGLEARSDVQGGNYFTGGHYGLAGTCERTANRVTTLLQNRHDYSHAKVVMMPVGETNETHFVVTIPISDIDETTIPNDMGPQTVPTGSTADVILDPTIQQFCSENATDGHVETALGSFDNLPRVAIVFPTHSEYTNWYNQDR